ncbi:hypothetical protein SUDANB120_00565 [Streptomyces sp. enrichment culture]|uniref:BON domain-containing protein n=1 Tax=Streptomyces TaxID=1883 RepID=UPI0016777966|nr:MULTISPECIES: BON domain-containing protein [Streptomyces]MBD3577074.1 BON domain-containing protein [Streptomyces sp. KD18]GGT04049.1 hypothetical protein GCM10010286_31370 [Streptomyces toxytricini]
MTGSARRHGEAVAYRAEHLRERLARDDLAELGVQIDLHGPVAVLTGTVTTAACREQVLSIAAEELDGLQWRHDIRLAGVLPPPEGDLEDLP